MNGIIEGTGFLISHGYILTCTHVVEAAINDKDVTITISFSRAQDKQEHPAELKHYTLLDNDAPHRDIAVLAITAPLNNAQIIPLPRNIQTKIQGHVFRTLGFSNALGEIADGSIAENKNDGLMQINYGTVPIVEGYSGAPVWDKETQSVIGMVTWSDKVAYCISMRYIEHVWENEFSLPTLPNIFTTNPYKGLDYFHREDAERFYGRDEEIAELNEKIQHNHFIAVIGNSGTGKSSVVFAGLVPRLDEQEWCILSARPKDNPLYYLAQALVGNFEQGISDLEEITEAEKYKAKIQEKTLTLAKVAEVEKDKRKRSLLIIIDQFEELYTLTDDDTERQKFIDLLIEAVNSKKVHIIITLRTDFLSYVYQNHAFGSLVKDNSYTILPIEGEEKLSNIIELPDANGNARVYLAEGLRNLIIKDAQGELALLQFALEALWQEQRQRNSTGELTHSVYNDIGGVDGALERKADAFMQKLSSKEQQHVLEIMLALLKLGEGTEDTRRIATKSELGEDKWRVVTKLANARLVRTSRQDTENTQDTEETAEIIHEALIRNWQTLRDWLSNDVRDFLRWREGMHTQLTLWKKNNKSQQALLTGLQLEQAKRYVYQAKQHEEKVDFQELLTDEQTDYIRTSKGQEQFNRNRVRNFIVGAAILLTLFAGIATNRWWNARAKNNELVATYGQIENLNIEKNELEENAQQVQEELELTHAQMENLNTEKDKLEQSVQQVREELLGIEEAKAEAERQTNRALLQTLNSLAEQRIENDTTADDDTAMLLADEALRFAEGHDLDIRNSNLNLRRALHRSQLRGQFLGHNDTVIHASFSSDDSLLVTASADGTAKLWDVASGEEITSLEGHSTGVIHASFSSDDRLLVTASADGTAKLWDVASEQEITTLEGHSAGVIYASFSSDDRLLVTASDDGTAKLWDVASGQEIITLEGHSAWVIYASFSSDDRLLVTASADGTAKLWDVASGQEIITLEGHSARVIYASFSSDDRLLVTASDDSTAKLWDVATKEASELCQRAGRNLFKAEWQEFFTYHTETWEDYVARGGTCPQYPVVESIADYATLSN